MRAWKSPVFILIAVGIGASPSLAAPPMFGAPNALTSTAATDGSDGDYRPMLAADGNGNWVATWYNSGPTDSDIFVARSSDDGLSWSPAALLNSAGGSDVDADDYPTVATDGLGHWVTVWALDPPGFDDSDIMVSRSSDNGATWSPQAYLDSGAPGGESFDDRYPYVASNGSGTWIANWRRDAGDADIYFSRSTDDGATWTVPALPHADFLTDNGLDDEGRTASDGGSNWVMVWLSFSNLGGVIPFSGNIFVSRSADDGQTWSAPTYLNSNAPDDTAFQLDSDPSIASDKQGHWVTVWWSEASLGATIGTDADILVARSTDNGATWSPAAALNTDAATDSRADTNPTIVTDGNGRWVVVWTANEAPGFLVAESRDNGATWSAPQPINASTVDDSGTEISPTVGVSGNTYVVAWSSDENLGGLIGTDLDILFARGIACPSAPTGGCRAALAGKSSLIIKNDANDAKDLLQWKWNRGAQTDLSEFLDPLNGDPYLLCLYDAQTGPVALLDSIGLYGGGTCGIRPCWAARSRGFRYRDKSGALGGTTNASISAGASDKAKAALKAKGANVSVPGLPLIAPITVQLRNRTVCWTASYTAPFTKNDLGGFKDKSD